MSRRRLLLAVVGALLGLEVGWIVAFDRAAKSGQLERWVNRRPDRFVLRFAAARSWAPFHFSATGLEFQVQTPRWQWAVAAERVSGEIVPLPLLWRTLRFHRLEGDGVRVFARRRATTAEEAAASDGLVPRIGPWPHFEPTPGAWRYSKLPWTYEFSDVRARAVREVWIERARFDGELHASGAFAFRRRREAEIGRAHLELLSGRATLSGEPLAESLSGRVRGSISPYPYREERGVAMLPHLALDAELGGNLHDGTVLRRYLARATWLEFDDPVAPFTAVAKVRAGELVPGTRVEILRPDRRFAFFGFEALGSSRLELTVADESGRPRVELRLRYDDYELRRQGDATADFAGRGLELSARSHEPRLGALPDDARFRLHLGEARLVDLKSLTRLLPASAGIELLAGSGPVEGLLEADLATGQAAGGFGFRVEGARARVGEVEVQGEISFDAPLASDSLARRTFDLAGARLELSGFRSLAPSASAGETQSAAIEPWWARIDAPQAELELASPAGLRAHLRARLGNSAPLVALYDARRNLPRWVERLLSAPDVEARTDLLWRRGLLELSGLEVELEDARIGASLELRQGQRQGRLLLAWRKLALGIELDGTERRYRLRGARKWFEGDLPKKQ